MPELPEVETIKRGLSKLVIGKTIKSVWYDWPKSFPNVKANVDKYIIGAKVLEVKRRAKILKIELNSNHTLLIHLKMTGQLVYARTQASSVNRRHPPIRAEDTASPERWGGGHPNDSLIGKLPDKSTRVIISFEDGAKLFFNDQRKFGWVKLVPTLEVPRIDNINKLGPEPLSEDFTSKDFRKRLSERRKSRVKTVLLDQSVVSGMGNIYTDESLWAARIHPETRVEKLSAIKLNTLFTEIKIILNRAIDKGGSTDKNYLDAEGNKGSYLNFAKVFRREGRECPRCGTKIVKIKVAGRGTHLCPKCQKRAQ